MTDSTTSSSSSAPDKGTNSSTPDSAVSSAPDAGTKSSTPDSAASPAPTEQESADSSEGGSLLDYLKNGIAKILYFLDILWKLLLNWGDNSKTPEKNNDAETEDKTPPVTASSVLSEEDESVEADDSSGPTTGGAPGGGNSQTADSGSITDPASKDGPAAMTALKDAETEPNSSPGGVSAAIKDSGAKDATTPKASPIEKTYDSK